MEIHFLLFKIINNMEDNLLHMSDLELKVNYLTNKVKELEDKVKELNNNIIHDDNKTEIKEIKYKINKDKEEIDQNYDKIFNLINNLNIPINANNILNYYNVMCNFIKFDLKSNGNNIIFNLCLGETPILELFPCKRNYDKINNFCKSFLIDTIVFDFEIINESPSIDSMITNELYEFINQLIKNKKIELLITTNFIRLQKIFIEKIFKNNSNLLLSITIKDPYIKHETSNGFCLYSNPFLLDLKKKCKEFTSNIDI